MALSKVWTTNFEQLQTPFCNAIALKKGNLVTALCFHWRAFYWNFKNKRLWKSSFVLIFKLHIIWKLFCVAGVQILYSTIYTLLKVFPVNLTKTFSLWVSLMAEGSVSNKPWECRPRDIKVMSRGRQIKIHIVKVIQLVHKCCWQRVVP